MLVGGLALLALGLGFFGMREFYGGQGYRPTEFLYRSLQLFVLESGAIPTPSAPLTLEIARILAPAVAAYGAIRAVIALFRQQLELLGRRFLLRDHVVVAGLGAKGFTLAKGFREEGRRVVAIERGLKNPAVFGARRRGIPVLLGNATDPAVLLEARVPRARYLVVATGNDRENLDVAFTAANLARGRRTGVVTAFVHLDDLNLWRLLQARILAAADRSSLRIELFSAYETASRLLVERHHPFEEGVTQKPSLLVVGTGRLAQSVVLAAATAWRKTKAAVEAPLRVTIAGSEAFAVCASLASAHPSLSAVCTLEDWTIDPAILGWDSRRAGLPARLAFTAVYVCHGDEAIGLAAALALQNRPELRRALIVLTVEDEASGVSVALRGRFPLARVQTFGVLTRALTTELLVNGTNEVLARAKHEHYLESERERQTAEENPSLVPWERLDESLKESNRLFADNIGRKLEAAGCALVPAPLADPEPSFAFSESEIEELGRLEHDRWCEDLTREGWRWGRVKDLERKLHPSLVPWSELSEEERDKDREPIRALPRMLALVGFEILRPGGDLRAARPAPSSPGAIGQGAGPGEPHTQTQAASEAASDGETLGGKSPD
jgi:voltage-gated potassium channel Kch